jgi:hypothetical protein
MIEMASHAVKLSLANSGHLWSKGTGGASYKHGTSPYLEPKKNLPKNIICSTHSEVHIISDLKVRCCHIHAALVRNSFYNSALLQTVLFVASSWLILFILGWFLETS